MADMYASGDLVVTDAARELAIDIVLKPPVPVKYVALRELVNQITVGLLPERAAPPVRVQVGPAAGRRACSGRGRESLRAAARLITPRRGGRGGR